MALKKDLRAIDVWGLALGAIIGWGCFVLPGNAFLPKSGPLGMAIGMLIGAAMCVVISCSYGYLIGKFPVAGGVFIYADSAFGKVHSYICGWFLILAYWSLIPLNGTAVGMIGRYLFPGILQQGRLYQVAGWDVYAGEIIVASVVMIALAFANIKGAKFAGWTQTAVVVLLIGSILLVTSVVLIKGVTWSNLSPGFVPGKSAFNCIFAVVAMAPWAFIGFDCIPQAAEEYKFSSKMTLMLMASATMVAAVLYICINTVTAVVMPWQELLAGKPFWATGQAVEMVMGKVGLFFVGVAMFCAVVSGINAFYLTVSRLMYAMAKADALPEWFAQLDEKNGTPKNGILIIMVVSLVAPFFGREVLNWIVDMTSVGASLGFAYTCGSAAVIARKNRDTRESIVGVIGMLISIMFLGLLLIPGAPGFLSPQAMVVLLIWIALGVLFFFRIRTKFMASTKMHDMLAETCHVCD